MYLVLSVTLKKKKSDRAKHLLDATFMFSSFIPLYEPPFRGLCCPRPPFLSIALPRGELHKDLQHDSFLNLLPTVPNQLLIMRHVQQENNLPHSLSDWQMRQSLPNQWYVNQTVAFEMLFFVLFCFFSFTEYCWRFENLISLFVR